MKERLAEIVQDADFINFYSHTSKINADHSKKITKNKSYEAPWIARLCDLIKSLRKDMDSEWCMKEISKSYIKHCQTNKPHS